MQQMEDRMEERMTQLQSIQVEQGSQLSRILAAEAKAKEARVQQQQPPPPPPPSSSSQPPKDPARPASQKQAAEPLLKPDMPDVLRDQETKEESTSFVVGQKIDAAEGVEEGLKDEDDGELSIPVEHTTAAHKLLMWPSIKALLYPKEYDEDYVMKLEEGRGLIRVYGRGEGDDTSEGVQPVQQQLPSSSQASMPHASSHSTPTWDDGYPPSGSPTGAAAPWSVAAAAGATTPATSSASSAVKTIDHGLEESGVFATDPDTVRRLHLSYMDHLHKLHPFLDQNDLEKKLEVFIRVYCPSARPSSASVSFMNNHTGGSVGDHPRGAKRKRSCETLPGAACDLPSPVGGSRNYSPRIEQSIDNAVILLVLALGSICECRDRPVPGSISDSPPDYRKEQIPGPSLMHHRPMMSPAGSESAMPLSSSFYAAPTSGSGGGGSGSFTSPSMIERQRSLPGQTALARDGSATDTRHLRNMDVIPGLAYYGYATQILGSLQGANGLPHVQAALLAGLYAGQLAHPFQSHGWIYQAARACQVLVRSYVFLSFFFFLFFFFFNPRLIVSMLTE